MITVKIFQFNFVQENSYLLYDETKEAIIVDCGAYFPEEEQKLVDYVEQNKLSIVRNICTHLHFDHIFGNKFIKEKFGIEPEASENDATLLPELTAQVGPYGIELLRPEEKIKKFIAPGDIIKFGDSELLSLSVPGHSPGSLCFYNKKNDFLLSGDALFKGSVGRTDFWYGNTEQLLTAIREELLTLPAKTVVYPGHGPKTTIAEELETNPFL